MTKKKKVVSFFLRKIAVTTSVAASGDIDPSDATEQSVADASTDK